MVLPVALQVKAKVFIMDKVPWADLVPYLLHLLTPLQPRASSLTSPQASMFLPGPILTHSSAGSIQAGCHWPLPQLLRVSGQSSSHRPVPSTLFNIAPCPSIHILAPRHLALHYLLLSMTILYHTVRCTYLRKCVPSAPPSIRIQALQWLKALLLCPLMSPKGLDQHPNT